MKVIKLKKSYLKDPETLLRKVGAVKDSKGLPSFVYISKEDYKTLRNNTKKCIKNTNPWASINAINYGTEFQLLDLGPNQGLEDAIKPGYALIDLEGIESSE